MTVWDTDLMPVDHDPLWCPAHDAVSETLIALGVWEPQNTVVLMLAWEACAGDDLWFYDIGAQLGWFSSVAGRAGVKTYAVEADPLVAEVLARNIARNDTTLDPFGHPWSQSLCYRIKAETPGFAIDHTIVMKIDIEGAEADAIHIYKNSIDAGRVPYILMEVSPCFGPGYPELVTSLMDRGYHAYNMPPKQTPPVVIDQLSDLLPYRIVGDFGEVWDEVASWRQRDVFFALGGIEP
jgi:hypothetical protein